MAWFSKKKTQPGWMAVSTDTDAIRLAHVERPARGKPKVDRWGIVKLDDAGLYLSTRQGDAASARLLRALGRAVLVAAPALMKTLSVVGTAAMFLVGGGILVHGIPGGEAFIHGLAAATGSVLEGATSMAANALVGAAAGAIALAVVTPFLPKARS